MLVKHGRLLLLLNCIPFVVLYQHEKPLAEKISRLRCIRNSIVLNDCNWCRCNSQFKYTCDARVCGEVDMFGHFNDAVQDIDVGMEGHGVWRSVASACEPGVHYNRGALLCVCTEDGTWPNPVCRDTLRVLHPVEIISKLKLSNTQKCTPSKLYLSDCNVCICPSTGYIDPGMCTQKECSKTKISLTTLSRSEDDIEEVYAECDVTKRYKLGCQTCQCLRNNRLHCDNCTEESKCKGKTPGVNFNVDCNKCHCDEEGAMFCTSNICFDTQEETIILKNNEPKFLLSRRPNNDLDCEPGTKFRKDCNTCYCFQKRGNTKKYGCTVKKCDDGYAQECKIGETYSKHCQKCQCKVYRGKKMMMCESDPNCYKNHLRGTNNHRVYYEKNCKPMQIYENKCNTCQCLRDGMTLMCSDEDCDTKSISVDIIPISVKYLHCPKGHSYKIDCNYCICLPNGNAFCTTLNCEEN